MKKIRIGIIGCGRISQVYLASFKELASEVEFVIAIDKIKERAEKFASNFTGAKYSDSIEDLLAQELDVVHILTPHHLHKEQTILCIKAGIHVLTEKPIAIEVSDAREMISVAEKMQKKLGVIFQNRYIEGIQELKKVVSAGRLGKILGVWSNLNWHRPPSYYECDWKGKWATEGGGVVIDQAIHSIDLVRYILNKEVVSIQGNIDNRVLTNIEVEDIAEAIIMFEGKTRYCFYACNYFVENSPIQIEFVGENGRARLKDDIVEIEINGQEPKIIIPDKSLEATGLSYWGKNHTTQIKDFYYQVRENLPLTVDGEDATKTLEIVQGIYESSRKNKKIVFREEL